MNDTRGLHLRFPIVVLIIVVLYSSMLVLPAWSQSSSPDTSSAVPQEGTDSEISMQAASVAATILYFPFKAVLAIAGGLVGELSYVFSGFSEPTAKSVWLSSMGGTYVITPEHLNGDRPVRFLNLASENGGMPTAPATIHD